MKKTAIFALFAVILLLFCGCSKSGSDVTVGLVTDSGNIDDYSINEACWNGVILASGAHGCGGEYSVPEAATDESFASSIAELYNKGCRVIIAPGEKLASAVNTARSQYDDCLFVCIGFAPKKLASNVVSVSFAQNEAAFIAGFAAAQKLQSGNLAAVFGMDLPSSRKYSGGFKSGVEYSNKNYGTSVQIKEDNIIYAGSYNDENLGETLAQRLYSSGISCIFTDGGKTADGVFETAKRLRGRGSDVWVIGSQVDCYNAGIYEGNRSVTLTSAVSRISSAISAVIGEYLDDDFAGGRDIFFDCSKEGVGIPKGELNLSAEVRELCDEITQKIAEGEITVPDEWIEQFS